MLRRPAGARRSQIRSQDIQNGSPTDGRWAGAAFRHDVHSARLNVEFQSRPFYFDKRKKKRKYMDCFNLNPSFVFSLDFFGRGRKISVDLFSSPCHVK